MRIVKLNMDVAVPDEIGTDTSAIVSYLNNMLNYVPNFFGDFNHENIVEVTSEDGDLIYHR